MAHDKCVKISCNGHISKTQSLVTDQTSYWNFCIQDCLSTEGTSTTDEMCAFS